jgi:hypothetical protein
MRKIPLLLVPAALLFASSSFGATLAVGPGKTYAKPCAAFAAAADSDTIEIDAAGNYDGDVCIISKNKLTIRGVGGRAKIDAAGKNAGGKAIWVVAGTDTIIENIELSGATVPDKNGAGIRQEGVNLTVRNCYFHDNEDGILAGANAASEILIEYSEFARNGFGDGYSHNMYINGVGKFTLRYSYSHDAKIGHLVKTRALTNFILYNRLSEEAGTGSYELDMPNGGTSYVIGNVIQQGPTSDNSSIVGYGMEGATNPVSSLFLINNTIINDRSGGTFVNVGTSVTTPVVLTNNIFLGTGTVCSQSTAVLTTNFTGDPLIVDRAGLDAHLTATSPCIGKGTPPGDGAGFALTPTCHYVHTAKNEGRKTVDAIDIGAFEFGGGTGSPCGSTSPGDSGPTDSGPVDSGGDSAVGDSASSSDSSTAGDGDVTPPPSDTSSSGGCGCRVDRGPQREDLPSYALLAGLALLVRARSKRRD